MNKAENEQNLNSKSKDAISMIFLISNSDLHSSIEEMSTVEVKEKQKKT